MYVFTTVVVDDLEALLVLEDDFADNFVDLALVSFGIEFIEDFLDICDNFTFTDEESRRGILPTLAKVVLGLSDCLTRDARRRMLAAWVLYCCLLVLPLLALRERIFDNMPVSNRSLYDETEEETTPLTMDGESSATFWSSS